MLTYYFNGLGGILQSYVKVKGTIVSTRISNYDRLRPFLKTAKTAEDTSNSLALSVQAAKGDIVSVRVFGQPVCYDFDIKNNTLRVGDEITVDIEEGVVTHVHSGASLPEVTVADTTTESTPDKASPSRSRSSGFSTFGANWRA